MQRVGGQLGSNIGGIFRDSEGRDYYVKTLESPMHARNEWLAAKLYQLSGAPILTYVACSDPCEVATCWVVLDKKCIARFSESERRQAKRWFAVHAWCANWDAVGFDGDNQGVADGMVMTLDVGGSLALRACGDPKGKAFGVQVEEFNVLRQDADNPHALRLFGDMSPIELCQSIQIVASIADERIRHVITEHGGSQKLVDKMLARKADLLCRQQHLSNSLKIR
jgi:hypothetical protein